MTRHVCQMMLQKKTAGFAVGHDKVRGSSGQCVELAAHNCADHTELTLTFRLVWGETTETGAQTHKRSGCPVNPRCSPLFSPPRLNELLSAHLCCHGVSRQR